MRLFGYIWKLLCLALGSAVIAVTMIAFCERVGLVSPGPAGLATWSQVATMGVSGFVILLGYELVGFVIGKEVM